MKKAGNRRTFLKRIGMGTLGTGMLPVATLQSASEDPRPKRTKNSSANRKGRTYNDVYRDTNLNRIAFPIGGLGAGMFCIEGSGAFSHMSVRHKPDVFNEPGMFGAIAIKGHESSARVLEGPAPDWKRFGLPGSGMGMRGSIYGLPRFANASFLARFPFATISLEDNRLPLTATVRAWSPFIPTDADNSGLPVGAVEYTFRNLTKQRLECVFSFHAPNFMKQSGGGIDRIKPITKGFTLMHEGTSEKPFLAGNFAVFTDADNAVVDHCWFRGKWFDPLTITWEKIRTARIEAVSPVESGAPGASLYIPFVLEPEQEVTTRVMTAWYVPDSDLRHGSTSKETETCDPETACCVSSSSLGIPVADSAYMAGHHKPWYSNRFKSINEVAQYWRTHYKTLEEKTRLFSDTLYQSTVPPEVMEAVTANLTILKSPTVLRQYDGRLWNYEGSGDNRGSGYGSCTHVWNYAQAIAHLFPAMERTLRHTEHCESQDANGHQRFRTPLPIRPPNHAFYAAADGQLGGVMKVYREWRISGDNRWLEKMYPLVKTSIDYCIRTWDPRGKGILEEPHHNTYDIEFWGPDGMCTSFYLGALSAMTEMARFLRKRKDAATYRKLYERGKAFLEDELFDGEYFFQKIQVEGLDAPNPAETAKETVGGEYSDEAKELLAKEGPKYQYGKGCLSDGVTGAWLARMCGLPDPFDAGKIRSHLLAVHRYNLRNDLSDHANPQRPGFAFGNEGGLLLCSWPKGGKLTLPFVYSNEVWTGIEYQVASHLMLMGRVEEGLEIVRTCRDRYDGIIRNPFNEYEYGNWYARALASYGLLQGLTGVWFDAVEKTLYVDSRIGDFTTFLSTASGFGLVMLANGKPSLKVVYGTIPAAKAVVSGKETTLVTT